MAEHYYTEKQSSAFSPKKIKIDVLGMVFELYTAGGVFSPKRLDPGTRLLIESAKVKKGWKLLDLGCGYGVVGIAIKKKNPAVEIFMSDPNTRAVKLANMNVKLCRIDAEIIHSDVFSNPRLKELLFDTILLNPPQTAGKDVCFRMIAEAKKHLVKGGLLQIVARSQKGGKQLSKKMEDVFGNIDEVSKKSGYRVYVSKN